MLTRKCTILRDPYLNISNASFRACSPLVPKEQGDPPILRIMRFLQRITSARVPRGENPLPLPRHARRIELHLHQLIHVLQRQHVRIQLHDSVILDEAEGRELAPAIVEAWVVGVVHVHFGEQVLDVLLGNAAALERGVPFGWEGVGVECDERVL